MKSKAEKIEEPNTIQAMARKESEMSNKEKFPENLGNEIMLPFFDASEQQIYEDVGDFLKEVPEVKEDLENEGENDKKMAECFISGPAPYTNLLLSIGFVLGQKFDLNTDEAQKEIDFIWKWMKEKNWFFLYPREKKAA